MRHQIGLSVQRNPLAILIRTIPQEPGRPLHEQRGPEVIPLTREDAEWLLSELQAAMGGGAVRSEDGADKTGG